MQKVIIFTLFLSFSWGGLQAGDPEDKNNGVVSRTISVIQKTYKKEPAKFWTTTHFLLDALDAAIRPNIPKFAPLIEVPRFIALFQANKHLLIDVRDPSPQINARVAKIVAAHSVCDIAETLLYMGVLGESEFIKYAAPFGATICLGTWMYEMLKPREALKEE